MVAALELPHPNASAGDQFGSAVSISDSFVLVGAQGAAAGSVQGAGCAFWMSWSFSSGGSSNSSSSSGGGSSSSSSTFVTRVEAVLTAGSYAAPGARFGSAVAMADGYLVVGADSEPIQSRGAAYVWQYSYSAAAGGGNTTFLYRLESSDALIEGHFGLAIAIHGGVVVIGAPGPELYPAGPLKSVNNGAVFVYDLATGTQLKRLRPLKNPGAEGMTQPSLGCFGFGTSVAVAEGIIVVGAPRARQPCAPGTYWGAAWTYERSAYNQTAYLSPAEGATVVVKVFEDLLAISKETLVQIKELNAKQNSAEVIAEAQMMQAKSFQKIAEAINTEE